MQDLDQKEFSALVDLLSEHTAVYTRLLAERNRSAEFDSAKRLIKAIQAEINKRKTVDSSDMVAYTGQETGSAIEYI